MTDIDSNSNCIENLRNVNLPKICNDISIRLNKQLNEEGYKITVNTLGFTNRERCNIRITNTYTFDDRKIIAIWNNVVSLIQIPISTGKMKMYPKLSEIWITVKGEPVNSQFPADVITKMKCEINNIIGNRYVLIDYIDLDQFEMLRINNIFKLYDLIFEKLLIYADLKSIASSELIQFARLIPDDIEILVTIKEVLSVQTKQTNINNNITNVKYINF